MSIDNTGITGAAGTTGTTGSLLHTLTYPNLGDSGYGQGLNDLVNNINENFQKIVSSEFLRGPEGKSINLIERLITDDPDNNGYTYAVEIFNAITDELDEDVYAGLSAASVIGDKTDSDGNLIVPRISLIYETVGSEVNLISSLPFVFIDPRFTDLDNPDIDFTDIEDCSCIVQYMDGSFKKVQTFPTLYYDVNVDQFCWKLNGVNTGLIARGPKGDPGNNGHIYVMEADTSFNTYVSNKYKVNPFITEETNVIENINNGDFAFIAKLVNVYDANGNVILENGQPVMEYKYYIGLLKVEDGGVFAIINDNAIYDQFTGANFNEYLKKVDINSNLYPKGLFIPIDTDANAAHIICANALTNINNNNNNSKLNMNILPVASLNAMNSDKVQVIRAIGLLFTPKKDTCILDNPESIREVEFFSRITSKTTLLNQFSPSEVLDIVITATGIEYESIENVPESINIYYFQNAAKNIHVFSRNLNVYDDDLFIIDQTKGVDQTFYSDDDFDITFKYNYTYLKDTTGGNNRVENTSLNFGYESINIGVDSVNENQRMSTLNVKGDIIATSNIRSEMIKANTAEIDTLQGIGENSNINIMKPILTDANIIGENTTADNIVFGNSILVNANGISGDSINIDADEINIMSKTRSNTDALNISIPSNITRDVNISIGDNNLYITDKTISGSNAYSWPTSNKSSSTASKSMSSGGSISGASNTSSKWRSSTGTASQTYTLTYSGFPTTNVTNNKVEFKPLIVSFSYQGRSYVWGTTDCPKFPYGVRWISVIYYTNQSGTEVEEYRYYLESNTYSTQIRFTSGDGDTYFANSSSGSSYTDYITINIPPYTTKKPLTKVVVTFNAYISGNNGTGNYTTAGDVHVNSLLTGANYVTSGANISASRSTSVSTGSYFMKVTTNQSKGGLRTVICADGILIGTGSGSNQHATLRWNSGGYLELQNVKVIN